MRIVIFDIDGCLADNTVRVVDSMTDDGLDFNKFFNPDLVIQDKPIYQIIKIYNHFIELGYDVRIFSSRPESLRVVTERWLDYYGIKDYSKLRLRPNNNKYPAYVLKQCWMRWDIGDPSQILCAFDDDDRVIRMWTKNNVRSFQTTNNHLDASKFI